MNDTTNKTHGWMLLLALVPGVFVLAPLGEVLAARPAPPAKPDPCTKAISKVAAAWPELLRKVDKRTVDEAAKAATAGALAYKTGMNLLITLANHARATGDEGDLAIAQVVDAAVTELKVVAPTTAAIAAWARANQACDQVKLLTGEDPNSICESAALGGKVGAACKACDGATATMQALAAGTPAGEHNIEELIEAASAQAGSVIDGLVEGGVADHPKARILSAALTKHLSIARVALNGALESSSAGVAAWDEYDALREGTDGAEAASRLGALPTWTQVSGYAKAIKAACTPAEAPAERRAVKGPTDCSEQCAIGGECSFRPNKPPTEGGRCVATRDEDCKKSKKCDDIGWCTFRLIINGMGPCVAASDEDCQRSKGCKEVGQCSIRAPSLICEAHSDAECRASVRCQTMGMCSASGGVCGP